MLVGGLLREDDPNEGVQARLAIPQRRRSVALHDEIGTDRHELAKARGETAFTESNSYGRIGPAIQLIPDRVYSWYRPSVRST